MKDIIKTAIVFFYFLKWPIAIGLPLLYLYFGLNNNWIMNVVWVLCVGLIVKDAVDMVRRKN